MYACSLGDVRVLFLEKGESRHATALRGARSRLQGGFFHPYLFSKYVKVLSYLALRETRYCAKAAYRTKSVCENPYNTRYLLVL